MNERDPFFDLIVGDPKSGKTTLLLALAADYQAQGWQVIYMSLADTRLPNDPMILTAGELDEARLLAENFEYSILCIDELADFVPADEQIDERIKRIVRQRRHVNIAVLGASQCPWDINRRVRKLYDRIYWFSIDEAGQDWLRRHRVPEENLVVPEGTDTLKYYNVRDKHTGQLAVGLKLEITTKLWRFEDVRRNEKK